MTRAVSRVNKSKESLYITCRCVFVSVQPETDTPQHLKNFRDMYDPAAKLIALRERANDSPNLVSMMRDYHVPIGLSDEEKEKLEAYFERKTNKKWY